MKKSAPAFLLFMALNFCTTPVLHSQNPINVCEDCTNLLHNFDMNSPTDSTLYYFAFDTTQVNNLWVVGHPVKTAFTTGYIGPRALVTDTLDPYPVNNVSSFSFAIKNCTWWNNGGCGSYGPCLVYIAMKMDSDTLMDGGTIEVSHNGSPFINLLEDSLAYYGGDLYSLNDTVVSLGKPGFSGTSANWANISVSYWPATSGFDTITFRLTFASDGIQTNKDGWMIGLVQTDGIFEGIGKIFSPGLFSVSPNPGDGLFSLEVKLEDKAGSVTVYSANGREVKSFIINDSPAILDLRDQPAGLYVLHYQTGKYYSSSVLIKER
jgi:hypothetical protein